MKTLLLLLTVLLWIGVAAAPALEIVAHRGASGDAPENTIAALRLAWRQGADAVEFDIHQTRDGHIVLIHDADTRRTTGVNRIVARSTLEELRQLDAGAWRGPRWRGERIPTLAEALASVPRGKRVFIEFKVGPQALPEVERVVRASGKASSRIVFISFDLATVAEAKRRNPAREVHWVVSPRRGSRGRSPGMATLVRQAAAAGVDGLFLQQTFQIDAASVARIKGAGLQVYSWTVNDPGTAGRLAAAGLDGIVTDHPGWMRRQLR